MRAHNLAGDFDSIPAVVVLAAVPDTPLSAPSSNAAVTDTSQIAVSYGALTAAQNGGSDVLSYELQVDDGRGGDFRSLLGNETSGDSLETFYVLGEGITGGGLYRFRYRARNVNGWSIFSPVAYLRAADAPGRPAAPILVSVDATAFTVRLPRAATDGGSSILWYELWRNRGTGCDKNLYDCAEFIKVDGFDGLATTHTLTVGDGAPDHLLTAGSIYLLRSVAVNSLQDVEAPTGDALAYSEASEEIAVGVSSLPAAPASLTKVDLESTATYITLQWA